MAGLDPSQLAPLDGALGVTLLLLAGLTLWLRVTGRAHYLGWREGMQRALGERGGDVAHFLLYTISPAILGVCFLVLWSVRRSM